MTQNKTLKTFDMADTGINDYINAQKELFYAGLLHSITIEVSNYGTVAVTTFKG